LWREHGWRLRALVVGGARLDPDLERAFKDLGYLVVQGYGLTETAPIISVSNPFDDRVGILGRPTRSQEVRIGFDGEILVRGGNVTPGYFDDSAATSAAFESGWFRTGDLGALEADGSLRFVGRKKDVIVTGEGQNVFPEEVEEVLRRQVGILDACVVAVPGGKGEEVHAAVIAAPGGDVGSAIAAANEVLAAHQRVRGWSVWGDLDFPRTATGKVLRREVVAALPPAASSGTTSHAAGPLDLLRDLAGPAARTDQRLGAELGLSSIDVAELASSIEERYQIAIDPSKIHEDTSLDQLLADARSAAVRDEHWVMPRWARGTVARIARGFLQTCVVFPFLRIFVRLEVHGRDRLADLEPPFLLAANHASHLDVPVLLSALPRGLRRRVAVAMQPEYFEEYLTGRGSLLHRLGQGWGYNLLSLVLHTFPFPRSAAFGVARDYAGSLADEGWAILVFPEGELSRDGAIRGFRTGVGVLARALDLRVVPARLEGLFELLPRGGRFPSGLRRPVRVTWGRPISMVLGEEAGAFGGRLEAGVRGLRVEEIRGRGAASERRDR